MRTCSWIELTLFALLLVGAGSRTQASAQQAPALRPLRVDDYFALKNVGGPRVRPGWGLGRLHGEGPGPGEHVRGARPTSPRVPVAVGTFRLSSPRGRRSWRSPQS